MDHCEPVGRRILGLLEDERRIGLVHADFDGRRLGRTDRLEEALSQRYAAGRVDDEVRRDTPGRSANVLEPHACDAAIVGGGDHLGDARAMSDFDMRLLFDPPAADALERRARQSELVVSEVALRKGVETGQLDAEVAAKPHPDGAGLHEIDLDPREHTVERGMPAREQRVRVARLRRAGTRSRSIGQGVAVEHHHLLEMGLDRLRRRQPRHSGADDDGLLEDWIAHFGYLQR